MKLSGTQSSISNIVEGANHNTTLRRSIILLLMAVATVGAMITCTVSCNREFPLFKVAGVSAPRPDSADIVPYITKADGSLLLAKQSGLKWGNNSMSHPTLIVDDHAVYQTMKGFGYTLTGGSAQLIASSPDRKAILADLMDSLKLSYLRISIGASDLSAAAFTYNDLPKGTTDPELKKFNIWAGDTAVIPILKDMLAVRDIEILATPWSAPAWMKSSGSLRGGRLLPKYYAVYAQYLVTYVQEMKAQGIAIDAMTVQNEPLHGGNMPSMEMSAEEQYTFIHEYLGPAFEKAGLSDIDLLAYDHNCDKPEYPITVCKSPYVQGSAFHLYGGDIAALSAVKNATGKDVYFTEQWTGAKGNFGGDLLWHIQHVLIGATRNWARSVLEWNLANDPQYGPHTDGGCTECKGAFTVNETGYTRNVSYYILAHAASFVGAGARRIGSNMLPNLPNVAFEEGDKIVLILCNTGAKTESFNIAYRTRSFAFNLPAQSVCTLVWNK